MKERHSSIEGSISGVKRRNSNIDGDFKINFDSPNQQQNLDQINLLYAQQSNIKTTQIRFKTPNRIHPISIKAGEQVISERILDPVRLN
jgi:hypothetical protein